MPATTNTPASDAATAYEAIVIGGSAGALDALSVVLPTLPASLRASVPRWAARAERATRTSPSAASAATAC